MGGLQQIREQAALQFRQDSLCKSLHGKRAVLIDAGFCNAIAARWLLSGGSSSALALMSSLRWLKSNLPTPDLDPATPLEVTVSMSGVPRPSS